MSKSLRRYSWCLPAGFAALLACQPPADPNQQPPATGDDTGTDDTNTTNDDTNDGTDTDGTDTGGPQNCEELMCSGHGTCIEEDDGPRCDCDDGYVIDQLDASSCIVDETCIEMRLLREDCRQLVNDAPAVALFFGVDFCAGSAVTPEKLDQLGLDFKVLENGDDIADNPESNAAVIDKDVESVVTLVLDASDSLVSKEEFPQLMMAIRDFVQQLKPAQDEAPVHLQVLVFARNLAEFVPLTANFDTVDAALESFQNDPQAVSDMVSGMGTSLYDAVELGINKATRARKHREHVTNDGVLVTGTVVVITDGKESSNGSLNNGLLGGTLNQVISVGVSDDIGLEELDEIGRDGSFLAPLPEDWAASFDEIAVRVDEYPDRAYLLAYCSSTSQGKPDVTISLDGIEPAKTAMCKFNADLFASNPPVCDLMLFNTECDDKQCGGYLTACGGCADDQCCSGTVCEAPTSAIDCKGQDDLCNATDQICGADGQTCVTPPDNGQACLDGRCDPGVGYCVADVCVATKGLGALCTTADECSSLKCAKTNPQNPNDDVICQPPAEMSDSCSDGATCEIGSYCEGSTCVPRKGAAAACGQNEECRFGFCDPGICQETGECYWSWDEIAD
jgi:hypothetical protein